MREVGVLEAKTNLSALVTEVERNGEEVVITRHGRPAAKLVRISPTRIPLSELAARARAVQEGAEARGGPFMDIETEIRKIRDGED